MRLRSEPDGVHRLRVATGSLADGQTIAQLGGDVGDMWVSIVVRDAALVSVRDTTVLEAGDDVVVLADSELSDELHRTFERPADVAGR